MSLVSKTSLSIAKTVRGTPLTGSYGSNIFIALVISKTVVISDVLYRPDPETLEQVAIIESHWIADVSISYVMVHRYQC